MARHLIYKQKVTLHLSKKDEAYALQDRVSRLLQNGLMDNLELILDAAFPHDKVVRIDKLQLDLGNISFQNFESEFKTQFISALTKSLAAKKESLSGAKGEEAIFSKAQSVENALIFFLEKGYLPWYSQAGKKIDWEEEILAYLNTAEYKHFFNWLKDNYQNRPVIIERIVLQFSDEFIAELLLKIAPVFDESWELIFADFLTILTKSISAINGKQKQEFDGTKEAETYNFALGKLALRDKIWQYTFRILLEDRENDPAFRILKLLFRYVRINGENIRALLAEDTGSSLKTKTIKQVFDRLVQFLISEEGGNGTGENSTDDINRDNVKAVQNKKDECNLADEAPSPNKNANESTTTKTPVKKGLSVTKKNGPNEGDVIYVNCSGVVMLHPFLKPYFESLELAVNGRFLTEDARSRAVLLLHYIATGETEAAEFDLTLQKILCGQSMEDTLPSSIELTDKEVTETDNLLRSVLSHWEPLKNTSIDGFRGTFLQRNGNLELKDSGWLLTVEQKTIDILLGKLPWGFSTIRLPWMQEMLSVDWY
ncbi:MAG: contractile injection system tape measure protein [Bacteroidota bacterium]|nr:contractile injection system tape measure protein [Bacteroidota bacterium]